MSSKLTMSAILELDKLSSETNTQIQTMNQSVRTIGNSTEELASYYEEASASIEEITATLENCLEGHAEVLNNLIELESVLQNNANKST